MQALHSKLISSLRFVNSSYHIHISLLFYFIGVLMAVRLSFSRLLLGSFINYWNSRIMSQGHNKVILQGTDWRFPKLTLYWRQYGLLVIHRLTTLCITNRPNILPHYSMSKHTMDQLNLSSWDYMEPLFTICAESRKPIDGQKHYSAWYAYIFILGYWRITNQRKYDNILA